MAKDWQPPLRLLLSLLLLVGYWHAGGAAAPGMAKVGPAKAGSTALEHAGKPLVRLQPLTRQQYEALAGPLKAGGQATTHGSGSEEGRLIAEGLAAIKGLAVDLTTGLTTTVTGARLPGILRHLVAHRSAGAADEASNKVLNDGEAEGSGPSPLCAIVTEDDEVDDDDVGRRSLDGGGDGDGGGRPVINCVFVVKKREGEAAPAFHLTDHRQRQEVVQHQAVSQSPWYFNPYEAPPSWYGAVLPPVAYFAPPPPTPPYAYPVYPPSYKHLRDFEDLPRSKKGKKSAARWRNGRALRLTAQPLAHKFSAKSNGGVSYSEEVNAVDAALPHEEEEVPPAGAEGLAEDEAVQEAAKGAATAAEEAAEMEDTAEEVTDYEEEQEPEEDPQEVAELIEAALAAAHDEPAGEAHVAIVEQPKETTKSAYQPAHYPQIEYISNYPKVTYAHALPYPAPVYVPPLAAYQHRPATPQSSTLAGMLSMAGPPTKPPTRTTTTTLGPTTTLSNIILAERA